MATLDVINFHNQRMAEEKARVMLRIQNGLKSDSSALIARRMMNPSFKGLPANSTGSRNMPFFATKNEIDVPLEAKIKARGGVIQPRNVFQAQQQAPLPIESHTEETDQLDANPNIIAPPFIPPMHGGVLKDYKYAKKILNQRKLDIENQKREEIGMMPEPEAPVQLTELDSRKLELAQLLDYFATSVSAGDYNPLSSIDLKNLLRLTISLAPVINEDDLASIVDVYKSISEDLISAHNDYLISPGVENNEFARLAGNNAKKIAVGLAVFEKVLKFLQQMARIINSSVADKTLLAKSLAKELGSAVGYKETLGQIEKIRKYDEEAQDDEYSEPDFVDNAFSEGPTASSSRSSVYSHTTAPSTASSRTTAPSTASTNETSSALFEPVVRQQQQVSAARQRLNALYNANDIRGLQQMLLEYSPTRRSQRFFGPNVSRTVLRNAISGHIDR